MITFETPDPLDLFEFFEAEPVVAESADGYWAYEATDRSGVKLRLSFNIIERSLQITLFLGDRKLITVSEEGAVSLSIERSGGGPVLRARLESGPSESQVEIRIRPQIQVEWSRLVLTE